MSERAGTGALSPARLTLAQRAAAFRARHHVALDTAFFFLGFAWDAALLHRIDSTPLLIHQGAYLVLTAALVAVDFHIAARGREPAGRWGRYASYRLFAMHFFLGTLLNAFMVFYFRASGHVWAFVFLVGLAALMVVNEHPHFRARGPVVRVTMLAFAVTSYTAYLVPVLWGSLRPWQYPVAAAVGVLAAVALWLAFRRMVASWTFRRAVVPSLVLHGALVALLVAGAIPPVPLSLKHIGIYTSVTPHRDGSRLSYTLEYQPAPWWTPWRVHARTFVASEGTRAWAFVRLFAPARFDDAITFRWEFDDPKRGWVERGKPFSTRLAGGNESGYRTFAYSTMGREGRYRVTVLTSDGREIGHETFTFRHGEPAPPRTITDG